ncbi:hypothetical protein PAHAL_1G176600 [Panicum hallii]|uniref:Uncharacterized protein n=1 Tax=Panicum hallii TaxID=206008 RepID=A0A2T8KVP9_9POAL|nr:hypothetical protein PAHAL_1G176600 [Panicum hallii]
MGVRPHPSPPTRPHLSLPHPTRKHAAPPRGARWPASRGAAGSGMVPAPAALAHGGSERSGLGSDDTLAAAEPDLDDVYCFRSRRRSCHLRAGILGSSPPTTTAPFASSVRGISGCCAATDTGAGACVLWRPR